MNQLEQYIFDLRVLNQKQKQEEESYKDKKTTLESKIKKIFDKKKVNSYSFANADGDQKKYYRATVVQQKKVIFNPDMVEQVVDKKVFNQICIKKYEITDYEGLVQYMKSLGGNPSKFKSFISCDKTIDNKKVNQLSELGDITDTALEGCYTVKPSAMWIKITESEEEIDENAD